MNYTLNKRCEAHVTLKKGRVKEYGPSRSVYLKDGEEFEIELFNPHQKSVLAKITINGIAISGGGLVLRPGQRVYLERYLDVDRKFKFSTYQVENTGEAREAIANNGNVEVQFFYEQENYLWTSWSTNTANYGGNCSLTIGGSSIQNFTSDYNLSLSSSKSPANVSYDGNVNCFFSSSSLEPVSAKSSSNFINEAAALKSSQNNLRSQSLETGRVEQGGKSSQEFSTVSENFNSWSSESVYVKILPWSQRPVEFSEIRNYCTSCKTRIKKSSWKFCPTCGSDLNS